MQLTPHIHLEHFSSPNYSLSNCSSGYVTYFLCAQQPSPPLSDGVTICVSLSEVVGAQSCFVLSIMNGLQSGGVQAYQITVNNCKIVDNRSRKI